MKLVFDGKIYMIQNDEGAFWMGPKLNTWEKPKEPGADVPGWMTTSKAGAECQMTLLETSLNVTKNVTIPVPSRYKWLAIQPYGTITLYTNKPKIGNNGDYFPEEDSGKHAGQLIEFWDENGGEKLEIHFDLNSFDNWRESLREI
jgi:hypothetical protein